MSTSATPPGADAGVAPARARRLRWRPGAGRASWLFVFSAALFGPGAAAAGTDQWLLMVRTLNKEPARTAEFNDWYEHIDVPDVLKVPGFERARRGQVLVSDCPKPPASCAQESQRYVALYDIGSKAIDKTIIDMLMATWKMLQSGRDTPLLKVEERVYYHETAAPRVSGPAPAPGARTFLLLERFDIAPRLSGGGLAPRLQRQAQLISARSGAVTMTRYELYRVLMFEPTGAPRFLTIFKFPADSDSAAEQVKDALVNSTREPSGSGYLHADALLYRQLSDVQAGQAAGDPGSR
jgi:hypothetical protein